MFLLIMQQPEWSASMSNLSVDFSGMPRQPTAASSASAPIVSSTQQISTCILTKNEEGNHLTL